jgi:hypothetical protein
MRYLALGFLGLGTACLPPLRSNYNFHDVPGGNGFQLVENIQSVEDYFYETQRALEALASAANANIDAGFDIAAATLDANLSGNKQIWQLCHSEEVCTRALVRAGACALPTLTCGESAIATYNDHTEYSVHVENNTWSIRYSSGHVLASAKVGVAAQKITPVTQLCHTIAPSICPAMQTIQLDEPIIPTSESNFRLGDTFVFEYTVESAKEYFYSMYIDLKAISAGLPEHLGVLGLLENVHDSCVSSNVVDCEKEKMYDITCEGDTIECGTVVKAYFNNEILYSIDTTESTWTLRYADNILATAPIGQGATTITPITQTNPFQPVTVTLATPFEPLFLGAYNLGTAVTCEFGTPAATCTNGVLNLSGCYASLHDQCHEITNAVEYISRQCCNCM